MSYTVVAVEVVDWSDVGARAARGDAVGVSPSSGVVGPSGPILGRIERCPTEPGSGRPGLGGDGEPCGECGKEKGARIGGSWRILFEEFLFQPRLGKLLGRGGFGAIGR